MPADEGHCGSERPDWLHEVKYDGYRLRLERDGDRARLITRGGYNWANRYPWIVEAARKMRQKRFVLDGEAVVLGVDGISDFDALHSRKHDHEVQFCAFDILAESARQFCRQAGVAHGDRRPPGEIPEMQREVKAAIRCSGRTLVSYGIGRAICLL
ncbi:hypothetical protein [Bradyrhizobium sp. WYCCWR 12677]|uniref:ATP-dependent DNA ligase n=1 Tax=Bradyrhizobium sp. WYCCWR 12677 TaxID=3058853 RepID=UPI00345FAE19